MQLHISPPPHQELLSVSQPKPALKKIEIFVPKKLRPCLSGEEYTRAFVRAVDLYPRTHRDTQRYDLIRIDLRHAVDTLAGSAS
jgi:hypothetical protein